MIESVARARPTVLVADDDEDILQLLTLRLESSGYDVIQARNGEDALRIASELMPALAVLDVMMPGLDGFEVTRKLRSNPATSAMPVILLTAKAQVADVRGGMAAGADDYIKKPFDARELTGRVDRLLRPRSIASGDH